MSRHRDVPPLMTFLDSFQAPANVALIGVSGGIGGAMLDLLSSDERVQCIHGFSRSPLSLERPGVSLAPIDVELEATVAAAADSIDESLDLVIVASGILWHGETLLPEKSMRELDAASFARLFAVNTTGPTLVAKHFLPKLRRQSKSVFAAMSAR